MLPRRGVVEIETLRRYGKIPIGTKAEGWFELAENSHDYLAHSLSYRVQIGDDPRTIGSVLYFHWGRDTDEPSEFYQYHQKECRQFFAANLFDYAILKIQLLIEDQCTSSGYQRFRMVRAEWQDEGE